jgi:hypothetical protein
MSKLLLLIIPILLVIIILINPKTTPTETGTIKIFFCPKQNCTLALLNNLDNNSKCAFYDLDKPVLEKLKQKNVSFILHHESSKRGLMHHKFCVTKNTVITGSFNPTIRADQYNNNNLIIINSYYLAKNYETEFNNLKTSNKKTPYPIINFNNFTIKNYFCPRDDCEQKVLQELQKANSSIYFMTFSFTSDPIGNLLLKK